MATKDVVNSFQLSAICIARFDLRDVLTGRDSCPSICAIRHRQSWSQDGYRLWKYSDDFGCLVARFLEKL